MAIFEGAGVALVTPFKENGEVNYEKLEEIVEEQIAGGTDAIIACGTTGEASTMSHEEHLDVVRYVCQVTKKRIPVIAGTGSNCTETAVYLSVEAEKFGADGLLLVSPYYNKATQKGLICHFSAVAEAVKIPILLYNIPGRTGVTIQPETIASLCKNVDNIVGVKEASGTTEGQGAWSRLKFEAGTHRVQRVPETESGGRIHTSTCTVAVLPQVDEVEFQLNPADLRIDTFRASGAGGQHINKTESAIRVTHLPTGTVVECQDQRSQYKNKDRALSILRARLYEQAIQEQAQAVAGQRRSQVGSGMRNERIRTYNFPQGRVTDHRIGLTLYKLDAVMNGELEELVEGLSLAEQRERLKRSEDG